MKNPDLAVRGRQVVDVITGLVWRTLPTPELAVAWAVEAVAEVPRTPRWLREAAWIS